MTCWQMIKTVTWSLIWLIGQLLFILNPFTCRLPYRVRNWAYRKIIFIRCQSDRDAQLRIAAARYEPIAAALIEIEKKYDLNFQAIFNPDKGGNDRG